MSFLLGNGEIGVSLNGNRKLYISDGQSLSVQVPYEALLEFSVEKTHGQKGTYRDQYFIFSLPQ